MQASHLLLRVTATGLLTYYRYHLVMAQQLLLPFQFVKVLMASVAMRMHSLVLIGQFTAYTYHI